MTDAALDLTPPTKKNGKAKEPKEAKAPKAKKEAAPKDPNAPKKPRGPRQSYGYAEDAVIRLVPQETPVSMRGNRQDWYNFVAQFDGLKVSQYLEAAKERPEPPRGWLRFFCQEGLVKLEGMPPAATPTETAGQNLAA